MTSQDPGLDLPAGLEGSPGESGGDSDSPQGQGCSWWRYWEPLIGMSCPGGHHFDTKTWPHWTVLQCWDASGQTTNRVGRQTHLSADRLPKVFLSPEPTLNTLLGTTLPTRGTKTQLHPPVGRHKSLPQGSLHKPLRQASHTRGQTPEVRGTTILQPVGPQTQKVRQNEMAEEYVLGE